MDGSLTYNSNNLQTFDPVTRTGINTNSIQHTDVPDSVAELYIKASANDSNVPDQQYPFKTIRLAGTIHGSSQSDLDNRIDTFKGYFVQRNVNLDIAYAGATRRYVAMKANSVGVDRKDKALFAIFAVELICKPFGLDTSTSNLWAAKTGFTSATFTETPTIGGNAPVMLPIITITINSLTGAGDYIQVMNDANNQEILLYGLGLEAGDVIVIDCEQRIVTVNDEVVNPYGTFIELVPGPASITYTDGFTTRDVDVSGVYTKRWV